MNRKSCLWLGLIALIVVCVAGFALIYFQSRARAFNSRPLVLIHSPVNHEQARVGEGVLVHATARSTVGIRRMELWANDILIDSRGVEDGSVPVSLILSSSWVPTAAGNHVLIVRAITSDGTEGQATVVVEVVESESASGTHVVEEGETLGSIAEEHGTTPEELAASNPELGGGEPSVGDELVIPDDEPPPAEEGAPGEEGGEPPLPEDDAPGESGSAFEFPFLGPLQAVVFGEGEPTGLRVEFLDLGVGATAALEGLHCYIGVGNASPRWYPDEDGDQTTDESFAITDEEVVGGAWYLAADMSGENTPTFYWPRNRDLTFSVSCVGIAGGGTEALELGLWEDSIPPEYWTDVILTGFADGPDGGFDITFRITRTGGGGRGIPLFLDPDMTPPTNARIDDRRISLRWDYNPRPDEERIDGFRVYLNGNLQWVEPADSRESGLPYEWLNPPCGTTYTFNITAYGYGLPDGPESLPAIAILEQPAEDCVREVLITFLTLETFDLGGDGRHEDRDGDVGPPYGYFFANEQQITFDGGTLESGGSLDLAHGFSHNTTYDLGEMSGDSSWGFNGMPALLVDIPDGGTFEFGFNIMDEDSGRCHDSDDSGCDDLICEGLSMIYYEDSPSGIFNEHNEGALTSEDGRCRVTYQWGPAAGSPVGTGVEGWEPLPWIDVEDFDIDESTGQVRIHVRNTGTATWPWRDLNVELQSREGASLGVYTWPRFVLDVGQRAVLEQSDMRVAAPFDACIMIDPYDDVLEEFERSGALFHTPICPRLPDLMITNVQFDSSGGGRLLVTVLNDSDGAVENRTLDFQTFLPDGTPAYLHDIEPGINLGPHETQVFDIPGVTESSRLSLANGYTVVVNPEGTIPESDTENNSFSIAPYQLYFTWCDSRIPHYHGLGSTARMFLTVDVLNGSSSRNVFEASRTNTLTRTETFSYGYNHCFLQGCNYAFSCDETTNFAILGDETLRVSIHADFLAGSVGDRENLGTVTEVYAADRYGLFPSYLEGTTLWTDTYCSRFEMVPPLGNMLSPETWFSYVCMGQIAS